MIGDGGGGGWSALSPLLGFVGSRWENPVPTSAEETGPEKTNRKLFRKSCTISAPPKEPRGGGGGKLRCAKLESQQLDGGTASKGLVRKPYESERERHTHRGKDKEESTTVPACLAAWLVRQRYGGWRELGGFRVKPSDSLLFRKGKCRAQNRVSVRKRGIRRTRLK